VRWRLKEGVREFSLTHFIFDLSVAASVSITATLLWSQHCRKRRPFQTSLRELLAVVTLASMALAAFKWHQRNYASEEEFLASLGDQGMDTRFTSDPLPWYLLPLRDIGVIDEEDWVYFGIAWEPSTSDEAGVDVNRALTRWTAQRTRLAFVRSAAIADQTLNDDGIDVLCKWAPKCTSLDITGCPQITDRGVGCVVADLPWLRGFGIAGTRITNRGIRALSHLPRLEEVSIDDIAQTTTGEAIHDLLELPELRSLGIPRHWDIAESDKDVLRKRRISVWYSSGTVARERVPLQ
jgi:hypothetical protein